MPISDNAVPPTKKPRKSRGRGLRTTAGCAVCRKRHIKCDEITPDCGPCRKANRTCLYESQAPSKRSTSAVISLDLSSAGQRPTDRSTNSPAQPRGDCQHRQPRNFATETPHHVEHTEHIASHGSGYGTELAPLRWFGLLTDDASNGALNLSSLEALSDAALAHRHQGSAIDGTRGPPGSTSTTSAQPDLQQGRARSPQVDPSLEERAHWQSPEPLTLQGREYEIFKRYTTGISLWIDMLDPLQHFSTLIPHLAMSNQGLMKATLALGARSLSIKPSNPGGMAVDRTIAVQYYYETLQYLQSAMRYASYKNSPELLATTLIISTYEMIDGAGKGWERHLKGAFWIQRSREINGESGGLEQAVWWAWLRQDVWAAFREHRRCFSFFKPTKLYQDMSMWDMASRVVYLLAQAVNYSSDEEKQAGETDLGARISRANELIDLLDEWRRNISVHFSPLPVQASSDHAFRPIWIHPPILGASVQMCSTARILLLAHQPAVEGYLEYQGRERFISDCVDTIGSIAIKLSDDVSRLASTGCLFVAGLYCTTPAKQECIVELLEEYMAQTGWPADGGLAGELRGIWAKQKPS